MPRRSWEDVSLTLARLPVNGGIYPDLTQSVNSNSFICEDEINMIILTFYDCFDRPPGFKIHLINPPTGVASTGYIDIGGLVRHRCSLMTPRAFDRDFIACFIHFFTPSDDAPFANRCTDFISNGILFLKRVSLLYIAKMEMSIYIIAKIEKIS